MKTFHWNLNKIKDTILSKLQADCISSTWHSKVSRSSNIHFDKILALASPLLSTERTEERVEQAQYFFLRTLFWESKEGRRSFFLSITFLTESCLKKQFWCGDFSKGKESSQNSIAVVPGFDSVRVKVLQRLKGHAWNDVLGKVTASLKHLQLVMSGYLLRNFISMIRASMDPGLELTAALAQKLSHKAEVS